MGDYIVMVQFSSDTEVISTLFFDKEEWDNRHEAILSYYDNIYGRYFKGYILHTVTLYGKIS